MTERVLLCSDARCVAYYIAGVALAYNAVGDEKQRYLYGLRHQEFLVSFLCQIASSATRIATFRPLFCSHGVPTLLSGPFLVSLDVFLSLSEVLQGPSVLLLVLAGL